MNSHDQNDYGYEYKHDQDQCEHIHQEHVLHLGTHTCLDCGEKLSTDMAADAGAGNQWSGAGGRTGTGKQVITARTMLQDLPPPMQSSEPPLKRKTMVKKLKRVSGTESLPTPAHTKKGVNKTKVKNKPTPPPSKSLSSSSSSVLPIVPAVSSPLPIPVPTTPSISVPTWTSIPTVTSLPTSLITLPETVQLPHGLHVEVDRLFRTLKKPVLKPQKTYHRLLFACVLTACEKLGLARCPTTWLNQFSTLEHADMNKALSEFDSMCPPGERCRDQKLNIQTELMALVPSRYSEESTEWIAETLSLLLELVRVLSKTSPMFNPANEIKQGRHRLALGLLHYYNCYLEPDQPLVANTELVVRNDIMTVAWEVDRCRGTKVFAERVGLEQSVKAGS
jgi:hypothetical protein